MIVRYEDLLCPDMNARLASWRAVFQYLGLQLPSATASAIKRGGADRGLWHFVNTLHDRNELYHIRERVSDVASHFYDDFDWPAIAVPPTETPRTIPFAKRTISIGGKTTIACDLRAYSDFNMIKRIPKPAPDKKPTPKHTPSSDVPQHNSRRGGR